jgi:hypothetical protein
MEVLEHIPDYKLAMQEMQRVLDKDGVAILSFPWLGLDHIEHQIRAELLPNGEIKHLLPPEYHGDPASPQGILSFRSFGWKVLDELRSAGFSQATAEYAFGPINGYLSMTPVFLARK